MEEQVDLLAKTLWDYTFLHHNLRPADCIIVLGSHDLRVAERGTQLYLEGYAPLIVFSGGFGRLSKKAWERPEADMFAEVAERMGVSKDIMLIENTSTNTGENISFTKSLLEKEQFPVHSAIVVTSPYMQRRSYATIKKQWPEIDSVMASPLVVYEHYTNHVINKEEMIGIMVGEIQRIITYPQKGYMIEQSVPDEVRVAYEKLIEFGFSSQLAK